MLTHGRLCACRLDNDNMKWVVHLLTLPQDTFALNVLQLNNYPKLMRFLVFNSRRYVPVLAHTHHLPTHARTRECSVMNRLLLSTEQPMSTTEFADY